MKCKLQIVISIVDVKQIKWEIGYLNWIFDSRLTTLLLVRCNFEDSNVKKTDFFILLDC
jgi:hypothetical protein